MGYEDFVYLMLSEEDKSSEPSLEYWYVFFIFLISKNFVDRKIIDPVY